mmetsp:Transcript_76168/g.174493  ORF Transcript_76168/g.174493 Transcript_76168/m.174493 type:complete len:213 (+) Transcript_76168:326-964(+)
MDPNRTSNSATGGYPRQHLPGGVRPIRVGGLASGSGGFLALGQSFLHHAQAPINCRRFRVHLRHRRRRRRRRRGRRNLRRPLRHRLPQTGRHHTSAHNSRPGHQRHQRPQAAAPGAPRRRRPRLGVVPLPLLNCAQQNGVLGGGPHRRGACVGRRAATASGRHRAGLSTPGERPSDPGPAGACAGPAGARAAADAGVRSVACPVLLVLGRTC